MDYKAVNVSIAGEFTLRNIDACKVTKSAFDHLKESQPVTPGYFVYRWNFETRNFLESEVNLELYIHV